MIKNILNIGQKCKQYREQVLGISQIEWSKLIGVTQPTVSRFENGKIDSLSLYCKYLEAGITDKYLLGENKHGKEKTKES